MGQTVRRRKFHVASVFFGVIDSHRLLSYFKTYTHYIRWLVSFCFSLIQMFGLNDLVRVSTSFY